jgi:hypothetical protein
VTAIPKLNPSCKAYGQPELFAVGIARNMMLAGANVRFPGCVGAPSS